MSKKLLIKHKVNKNGEKVVSAKELYLGLGLSKDKFARWYPTNIEKNEFFLENVDWVGLDIMSNGNQCKDFEISLEFAKHIAMMARTEKSHEYRNYFLDLEKQVEEIADTICVKGNLSLVDWNKIRFSEKRTINTFANSNSEEVKKLVNDFVNYAKGLDTETRNARCQSAVKGLRRLEETLANESVTNIGDCYNIQKYISKISNIDHIAENKRNGGIKAGQTKEIKQLKCIVKILESKLCEQMV